APPHRPHGLLHAALRGNRRRIRAALRAYSRHLGQGMIRTHATVVAMLLFACAARAELPVTVSRALVDAGVRVRSAALVVQEVGAPHPLFVHNPARPMNPASVMKLVTTF